jgi:hypothetical protein
MQTNEKGRIFSMKWLWRVYAVLYFLVVISMVVFFVQDPTVRSAINACTALVSLVAIVGLAAERRILTQVYWKIWFVLAIAEEIYDAILSGSLSISVLLLVAPYLTALYVYAFSSKAIWNPVLAEGTATEAGQQP